MKKLLAMLLVMMQLVTINAFASSKGNQKEVGEEIKSQLQNFLEAIQQEPDAFDMGQINLEEIKIGGGMSPYISNNDQVKSMKKIYYPVYSDNDIIGIMTAVRLENGETAYSFGREFSGELDELIKRENDFNVAVIEEENSITLVNKERSITAVGDAKEERSDRQRKNLEYDNIKPLDEVTIRSLDRSTEYRYSYKLRSVPKKKQETSTLCYAASAASIGEYFNPKKSKTSKEVATYLQQPFNIEGRMELIEKAVSEIWGCKTKTVYSPYAKNDCRASIDAGYPFVGGFATAKMSPDGTYLGHAMVFCGYYDSDTGFKAIVMDPLYGNYKLVSYLQSEDLFVNDSTRRMYYYATLQVGF